jgi:hypothetical protein
MTSLARRQVFVVVTGRIWSLASVLKVSMNPFANEAKRAQEHSCECEETNLDTPTGNQILIFQV